MLAVRGWHCYCARVSTPTHATWQPNDDQRALLAAALFDDARALTAWARWTQGKRPETPLDAGSERLLPLVANNLAKLGVPEDAFLLRGREQRLRGRFKGVLKVHDVGRWVRELAALGVPTLALKGLALAMRYYKDFGLRPMEDIDLLVRAEHVPAALGYLATQGFTPTEALPAACWPPREGAPNLGTAAVTHGCGFVDAAGRQLDLHWSALSTHCGDGADARFWAHAQPLPGVSGLALAPAHELVHVLTHGLRWNEVPSIRWIPDAAMILSSTPDFDWALFLDEVAQRGLGFALIPALTLLADFGVVVPAHVMTALAKLPVKAIDRLRFEHCAWPWDQPKPARIIAFDAWRFCEGLSATAVVQRLGRYAWFRVAPDGRLGSIPAQLKHKLARQRSGDAP